MAWPRSNIGQAETSVRPSVRPWVCGRKGRGRLPQRSDARWASQAGGVEPGCSPYREAGADFQAAGEAAAAAAAVAAAVAAVAADAAEGRVPVSCRRKLAMPVRRGGAVRVRSSGQGDSLSRCTRSARLAGAEARCITRARRVTRLEANPPNFVQCSTAVSLNGSSEHQSTKSSGQRGPLFSAFSHCLSFRGTEQRSLIRARARRKGVPMSGLHWVHRLRASLALGSSEPRIGVRRSQKRKSEPQTRQRQKHTPCTWTQCRPPGSHIKFIYKQFAFRIKKKGRV